MGKELVKERDETMYGILIPPLLLLLPPLRLVLLLKPLHHVDCHAHN